MKNIFIKPEYYSEKFSEISIGNLTLEKIFFEECEFSHCQFNKIDFKHCKFIDCKFNTCEFTSVKLLYSSFNNVDFIGSKLLGLNWTEAKWPSIFIECPVHFSDCDLSFSSFFGMNMSELQLTQCKAQQVDFRECILSKANFSHSDLLGAEFMRCKLNDADFREAFNYAINPVENNITNVQFSFPDVVNLLESFNIKIENLTLEKA
jgi:uncharacterized protein YjbI with pentapeptide repeats